MQYSLYFQTFILSFKKLNYIGFWSVFTVISKNQSYIMNKIKLNRDLKFENILLDHRNIPKISDFGFAIKQGESDELSLTHCGSYAYASPEVLKKDPYVGKSSDVWSL